ncbi:MAG: molecular chaperone DnaJ [Gammaproteobacteria bacterium]|nr:molecular chaperone DnaJ [Gammaproteobacteria bacterium]
MRGIFLIAILVVGYLIYTLYFKQLMKQGKAGKIKLAIIFLGLVFLALAAMGKAPAIMAVIGALMTQATRLLRYAPFLVRFFPSLAGGIPGFGNATTGGSGNGSSVVRTSVLVMTLYHDSGKLDGEVIDGPFNGRRIGELKLAELQSLYQYCEQQDAEATRLLQAYIARERSEEWQGGGQSHDSTAASSADMSAEEARDILGVDHDATKEDIITAHKSLIGKMHPDKGGSTYLATKINQAKQVLLG